MSLGEVGASVSIALISTIPQPYSILTSIPLPPFDRHQVTSISTLLAMDALNIDPEPERLRVRVSHFRLGRVRRREVTCRGRRVSLLELGGSSMYSR